MLGPGAEVELCGLVGRKELNGQRARLLTWQGERWGVECDNGEQLKVRPCNLAPPGGEDHQQRLLRVFQSRLQVSGTEEVARFEADELLQAVQAQLSECTLIDRTAKLSTPHAGQRCETTALPFLVRCCMDQYLASTYDRLHLWLVPHAALPFELPGKK